MSESDEEENERDFTNVDLSDEDDESDDLDEEEDSVLDFVKSLGMAIGMFCLSIVIASEVAIIIVSTYHVVELILAADEITPFRVIDNGIWLGYRHEFFDDIVPYTKAEQVCTSREMSTIIHFNSKEQEDQFDMYVTDNFRDPTKYPNFQLWTSGFVRARRNPDPTMIVYWPEPNAKGELNETRECGVRGEEQVNAFSVSEKYWQDRHIVKDYIYENQPKGINETEFDGCWQTVKRNDIAPKSFYRFVCTLKKNYN